MNDAEYLDHVVHCLREVRENEAADVIVHLRAENQRLGDERDALQDKLGAFVKAMCTVADETYTISFAGEVVRAGAFKMIRDSAAIAAAKERTDG